MPKTPNAVNTREKAKDGGMKGGTMERGRKAGRKGRKGEKRGRQGSRDGGSRRREGQRMEGILREGGWGRR